MTRINLEQMRTMNLYKFKITFYLLIFYLPLQALSQQSDYNQSIKKNLFYGSVGTVLYKYTFNVFYERSYIRGEFGSFGGRIGGGVFNDGSRTGNNYNAQLMMHYRKVEFGLGVTHMDVDNSESLDWTTLGFNLGVRLYNKNRKFMLRSGISFPEGIYLGVGFGVEK